MQSFKASMANCSDKYNLALTHLRTLLSPTDMAQQGIVKTERQETIEKSGKQIILFKYRAFQAMICAMYDHIIDNPF